jgi:ACS family glucarate transporter-like MFS transporter
MERNSPIPIRYILVFWLFLLSAVAFLDRTNLSIAGISLRDEYHLTNQQLGKVLSAFLIGYAAFQVPGGWLAERIGPRRLLTLGVLWWGVFTILTTVVPSKPAGALVLLMGVRIALGAGEAVIYPASNQFIARWFPVRERGIANGWLFAGVGAGAGLTPPLLTWLVTHQGWRSSFWFSAVVGFVVGGIWYVISRDTPDEHPYISSQERSLIREGLFLNAKADDKSPAYGASSSRAPSLWLNIVRSPSLWAITFSYFTYGWIAWIFFSWFYTYLAEVRHLDLKTSATYTMLPFIALTICCLLGGVVNDWASKRYGLRVGRCALAAVSLGLTAFLLAFGSTLHNAQSASLVLAASMGALYLSQSSFWSVTSDIAGVHSGIVSGVMNTGCQIGGWATAWFTPVIADHYGWDAPFFVAAGLALLGSIAWAFVNPTRPLIPAAADVKVHAVTS